MESIVKKNSYNEVLAKIRASRLSEREQREAVVALGWADAFVDLLFAVGDGLERLKQRFTLQPSFKP
jgi:hypothetical protein